MIDVLIQFTLPIVYILGITLFVSVLLNIRFERSLPVGLLGVTLLTFLFGFIDLRIGLYISYLMVISSIPLAVIRLKKASFDFKCDFCNAYFYAFLLIYVFIFALNAGKCFDRWDEYSHWGMMTKEMYRLNKYYYVEGSVLTAHPEYPPFMQIWQYMWCRLIGVFKESSLYNAKLTLCLSLLLSTVSRITGSYKKTVLKVPLISALVIILAAVPALADGSMYRTIYAEGAMVILTVYTIVSVLYPDNDKRYDLIAYALSMASLALVKQIGILFASISLLLLVILYIESLKKNSEVCFDHIPKKLLTGVISMFIPWIIWKKMSDIHTSAGQFDSTRFSVSEILSVMHGRGTSVQNECIKLYREALWKERLSWIPGSSYIVISLVCIILVIVMYMLYIKRAGKSVASDVTTKDSGITDVHRHRLSAVMIAILLTTIGYAIIMQVLYLFGFSDEEMLNLACFTRYMNSLLGVWEMIVILLIINLVNTLSAGKYDISQCKTYVCSIALCIVMIGIPRLKYEFMLGIFTTNNEGLFASDAERIREYTPEGSHIYFVDTEGNDAGCNVVRFLADGRYISDFYVAPGADDHDRVVEYMKDFDYIYLDNINDEFIAAYGDLFDGYEVSRQQMYKIDSDGISMHLTYVDMNNS